jgi:hypothetical protein
MNHFKTEDWIDYANKALAEKKKAEMRKHLDDGCQRCQRSAALWGRIRLAAARESSYQPPADTLRIVKAGFVSSDLVRQGRGSRGGVRLLFDSFLQPAPAGMRSADFRTRQMLYRADPYQLDLEIESTPGANHLVVTGQLLDLTRPDMEGRDVPVVLSNRRGNVIHAVANQFGEFRGEIDNSGDLELSFPGPKDKQILISLRDALGKLRGGRH